MTTFEKIKQQDQQRPGLPGEHLLTLAAGLGVWMWTRRRRSLLARAAGMAAATAFVGRAASGRDGLRKVLRWTPLGRGLPR